jgi:hypothetical protein
VTRPQPPQLVIVLQLEAAPKWRIDARNQAERERLEDWILAHDEYQPLLRAARDLFSWAA